MTIAAPDDPWWLWLGAGVIAVTVHALALGSLPAPAPELSGGTPGSGVLIVRGVALPSLRLTAAPAATAAAVALATPVAAVAANPALASAGGSPPVPATSSLAAVPIPSTLVASAEPSPVTPASPVPIAAAAIASSLAPAVAATTANAPLSSASVAPMTMPAPAQPAPSLVLAAPATAPSLGETAAARPKTIVAAAARSVGRPLARASECELSGAAADAFCTLVAGVPVGAEGRAELAVRPTDGIFFADEYLVVNVRLPLAVGGGHLYVLYLDHTGDLVHLRPNALAAATEVPAGARLRLGGDADQRIAGVRDWRFDPPYGQGLIVAWLTRHALPLFPRPEVEQAAPFLAALKAALPAAELVWVAHRPLESRPRA